MPATTLQVSNLGQIRDANVQFGDLTVLVGPQATGKSIFLELMKLLIDTGAVLHELKRHGLNWEKDIERFLDIYLGEGMRSVWREQRSKVVFRGEDVDIGRLIGHQRSKWKETMFFIPCAACLDAGERVAASLYGL